MIRRSIYDSCFVQRLSVNLFKVESDETKIFYYMYIFQADSITCNPFVFTQYGDYKKFDVILLVLLIFVNSTSQTVYHIITRESTKIFLTRRREKRVMIKYEQLWKRFKPSAGLVTLE